MGVHTEIQAPTNLLDQYELLVRKRAERQIAQAEELSNIDRQIAAVRSDLKSALRTNVERLLPPATAQGSTIDDINVEVRPKRGRPLGSRTGKATTALSRATLVAHVMAKLDGADNRVRTSLEPIITFLANEVGMKAHVKDVAEAIGITREACRLRCVRGAQMGILRKAGTTYALRK